jgi:hypothetical protein
MTWRAYGAHALVILAALAGIAGMGIAFNGLMAGNLVEASKGAPLLLIGLWWCGRELDRSMAASRARKAARLKSQQT